MTRSETYPLRRRQVVESLLADRGDLLVVAGLGAPCWDVTAAGDHALTFPLWGAMGSAAMIGLGLALAQPARRVLVITGDGEMLMGLGGLATIAVQAPENLAIAVLDNERYGETGMQATHTAFGVDLAAVAAAAGLPVTGTVGDDAGLGAAVAKLRGAQGPVFFTIKVRAEELPLALPPRDGVHLKNRFRRALLGEKEAV
ncbi:MAG: aldehyde dehydrogenase [Proteobacteria bacterium]|nr:aldehyde dehydrogenase [Pseudomonadota bacterium]